MEISSDQLNTNQQGKTKQGGLRTMPFIIANETFEKVAAFGLNANMILYLKNEYHLSNAVGAYVLFLWSAIANFMPLAGAFLSDSYLGRFRVIAFASLVSLLGMIILLLTAAIPQARPPCSDESGKICASPQPAQLALLFSSLILMAIGAGGIRPCSLAFGADQLDKPDNPNNQRILQSFFNWYYASVGVSIMISVTVIVYIQQEAGWVVGFAVPVALMFLAVSLFLLGSFLYVKVKPNRSLFSGFVQVIVVAWKNKNLDLPSRDSDRWYGDKDSGLVSPTGKLRFLNKACILRNPEKELDSDGLPLDPWKLCSVKQVEELKAVIKVLPIWSTGILVSTMINQHSFPVLQANTMNRQLFPNFKIPAGSFSVFTIITLTLWVAIYDRILVPYIAKITKRPRGLSLKQRMGIGVALACLGSAVAAVVERSRRAAAFRQGLADDPQGVVNMSAMWLVPQHCIHGLAEAFNAIGQVEFYYSQFPKSMASIAVALFSLTLAVGNLMGTLVVGIVNNVTQRGGRVSWVSNNLNRGHYDYYYWLLTLLGLANFFYYLICSWAYGSSEDIKVCDEAQPIKEKEEMLQS